MSELKPEFLGINSLNSFIGNISSPRSVMFFNHISQRPALLTPDNRLIKSGSEYELGKYINDIRVEDNCVVRAIVPSVTPHQYNIVPVYYVIVEKTKEINGINKIVFDVITIPYLKSYHTKFGYDLIKTPEFEDLTLNKPIGKDTVLARARSYMNDGSYGFGLNANVAFMSHPTTSEDGFVVSESFAQRAKIIVSEKRTIYINSSDIPLNIYGTQDKYKVLPDLGEEVRPDGVLFSYIKRNDKFNPSDLSDKRLKTIDYNFDTSIYVRPGSIVTNIEVITPFNKKTDYPDVVKEQLEMYAKEHIASFKNLISQVSYAYTLKEKVVKDASSIEFSPELSSLLVHANHIVNSSNPSYKMKLLYKKMPIEGYRIEVTVVKFVKPVNGYKLTCCHGGKGVICKILKDEDMPTDEMGNRADVIVDFASTVSRMNISRTYEAYFGAVARDNRQRLINYYKSKTNTTNIKHLISSLTKEDIEYGVTFIENLYALFSTRMYKFLKNMTEEEKYTHLVSILQDQLYLYFPPDNEIRVTDAITAIENSVYKPHYGPVTYTDNSGVRVKTKKNIRIGNFYLMFLEKIADSYMAVSSAKINNFSFPIKPSASDRNKAPHALTPARTKGETETRIVASYMDKEAVAELFDLNNNPISHKLLVKKILESDKVINIKDPVDRNAISYGQGKPLMIMKHLFNAAGMDFEYVPEDQLKEKGE